MEINLNRIDENKYTFKVSPSINEVAININDEYNSEYLLVYKYKDKIVWRNYGRKNNKRYRWVLLC